MSTIPLPTVPDVQPILARTIGALLVGSYFSICLFGANSLQTWYYYQHYPNDRVTLKSAVAFLWGLGALHAILLCHAIYTYTIKDFGNLPQLSAPIWSATATVLMTGILTLVAHLFFAWRVYILSSKRRAVPILLLVLAASNAGTNWVAAYISFKTKTFIELPRSDKSICLTYVALGLTTDLAIAASLAYYLHNARSGIKRTDRLINRFIFWAINVGILTSVVDLTVITILAKFGMDNLIHVAVFQIVSNLYAASILATLNARPFDKEYEGTATTLQRNSFHHPSSDHHIEIAKPRISMNPNTL